MNIKEIEENIFNEFAFNHPMKNYFQTSMYAEITSPIKYETMYIGAYENDILVGASLILYKNIGPSVGIKIKYGYAPRGFLINYYDKDFLDIFTNKIKRFFAKRGFAFIKINPEITYSKIDYINNKKEVNIINKKLVESLKRLGYEKLKDNLYFESMLPRFNAMIDYSNYNIENISEDFLNKINDELCNSLFLVSGKESDIESFYNLVSMKRNRTLQYYKDFYNIFNKKKMVDLLFIKMDYRIYLKQIQNMYYAESLTNGTINNNFLENPNDNNYYELKMKSDRRLSAIKSKLNKATALIQNGIIERNVATCLIIKQGARINLIISGYDKSLNDNTPNIYLYYKIIEEYKKLGYKFIDLNAVSGDFSDKNPYKELNDFKLSFKPNIYEYIGEFDLICNNTLYQILLNTNTLQKEFTKPLSN